MMRYLIAALLAALMCPSNAHGQDPLILIFPERLGDTQVLVVSNGARGGQRPTLEFTCIRSLGEQSFRIPFPNPGETLVVRCPRPRDIRTLSCQAAPGRTLAVRAPVPFVRTPETACSPPQEGDWWIPKLLSAQDIEAAEEVLRIHHGATFPDDIHEAAAR